MLYLIQPFILAPSLLLPSVSSLILASPKYCPSHSSIQALLQPSLSYTLCYMVDGPMQCRTLWRIHYTHTHSHIYIFSYTQRHIYVFLTGIYTYILIYVYLLTYILKWNHPHTYVHILIRTYMQYTYMCIHTYIYLAVPQILVRLNHSGQSFQ